LSKTNNINFTSYVIKNIKRPHNLRHHIIWHRFWARLRETLLTYLFDIKRQRCGIASVEVRLSFLWSFDPL